MNKNITILIIVILILIAGAVLAFNAYQANKVSLPSPRTTQTVSPTQPTTDTPTPIETTTTSSSSASQTTIQAKNTVTITSAGFTPQTITINKGESITWVNNDTINHTVNSDKHPTHLLFPFLNIGLLKPTEQKSLAFPDAGTFTYHDHLNAALIGKIIVK